MTRRICASAVFGLSLAALVSSSVLAADQVPDIKGKWAQDLHDRRRRRRPLAKQQGHVRQTGPVREGPDDRCDERPATAGASRIGGAEVSRPSVGGNHRGITSAKSFSASAAKMDLLASRSAVPVSIVMARSADRQARRRVVGRIAVAIDGRPSGAGLAEAAGGRESGQERSAPSSRVSRRDRRHHQHEARHPRQRVQQVIGADVLC